MYPLLLVVHMFALMHFLMHAGSVYTGVDFSKSLCGISVIRRYRLFQNILTITLLRLKMTEQLWQSIRGESSLICMPGTACAKQCNGSL